MKNLEQQIAASARAGHTAWMMTAAALVLFMTAPGLALFYGGLVRQKNVLSVMMQCLFLMGMMTLLWAVCGYSFAFGGQGAYFGNLDHLFMNGITLKNGVAPGGDIPDLVFMVFQGMFFIITPALICGAFAERMKFCTMVTFSILWGLLVYCPLCHWVWHDKGILYHGGDNAWAGGAIDFAGGTVVHMSSGISALLVAVLLGQRIGFGTKDLRPHNLTYTAMGAAMLWVGWFGFNAGSAAASNDSAANAFVVTHFSAAAGAVAWAMMEWVARGKPSILGTASGAVAGLVCITPASGCVHPMPAILLGLAAGVACYYACGALKSAFGYDDSLDAFGVHGVGGTLGALLIGIFATTEVSPGGANGLYYGGGMSLMIGQVVAVLVTFAFSLVATFAILKLLDATLGLRVVQEDEVRGLDLTEHGEEGYIFNR
ncbi:MAG: ammonium transporter [Planctomycetota bacterium]|nr:ammonium transporter [Planctomycetota bacterium]